MKFVPKEKSWVKSPEYGFNSATLENIAKHSGIKRPAIRHFIGNRDEVRLSLANRFTEQAKKHVDQLDTILPTLNVNVVMNTVDMSLPVLLSRSN